MAATDGQDEVVELDLILHIQTGLLDPVIPLGGQGRHARGAVVGGVVEVDDFTARQVVALILAGEIAVVQAHQQGVLQGAGGEVALQVVIEGVRAVLLAPVEFGAAGVSVTDALGGGDKTVEVKALVTVVDVDIAQALTIRHGLIEGVGKLVAHHVLIALVVVPFRVAQKRIAINLVALRVAVQAAHRRQGLIVGQGVITLDLRIQRQLGVVVGHPAEAGRQQLARILGVVHLFAARIADPDQPVTEGFGLVQRPREVKRQVVAVKTASADFDLVCSFSARAFGHHIDHAPRLVLPVQHRRRPFEDFDAFQGIGVDLWRAAQAPRRR